MMSKWHECTFSSLIQARSLEIGDGYRAKNSELGGDGPLFLRAGHVRDTHIDFDGVERFHQEMKGAVSSKVSRLGDVIVTTKGNSTGRTSYVSASMPEFVYSPHLSYWRSLDLKVINPGYLRYWSRSQYFRDQLAGLAASTDMAPYLSLVDQKRLRIVLPPADEQQAIAYVLGALDDKIDLNRGINETLEAMARSLFKSWFVDFDPVRANADQQNSHLSLNFRARFPDHYRDSELGKIPAGWTVYSLAEIADFLNGLALQKYPPRDDVTLPVIKIAQLRSGDTTQADSCSSSIPPEYVVDDGDVLFSWSGSLKVVLWCGGRGALNQHLFKVTSRKYQKWFYYLWTLHHLPAFQTIAADKATTMGHIQRQHLREAKIVVPSEELLHASDHIFAPLLNRMIATTLESRTLVSLRDTLLPGLLSGATRVKHAERIVAEHV